MNLLTSGVWFDDRWFFLALTIGLMAGGFLGCSAAYRAGSLRPILWALAGALSGLVISKALFTSLTLYVFKGQGLDGLAFFFFAYYGGALLGGLGGAWFALHWWRATPSEDRRVIAAALSLCAALIIIGILRPYLFPPHTEPPPAPTTTRLRSFPGHTLSVYAMDLSADGQTLVSGDGSGQVKIWDVASGRELHSFAAHYVSVTTLALSRDGRLLATGNESDDTYLLSADGRTLFAGNTDFFSDITQWQIAAP